MTDTDFAQEFMGLRHFLGPQRPDFYQILLFKTGPGAHSVDLVRYPVTRGTVITLRPGEVQEWDTVAWPAAKIMLFQPSLLMPDDYEHQGHATAGLAAKLPVRLQPTAREFIVIEDAIDEIREEIEQSDDSHLSKELLWHLLHALLIRLERIAHVTPTPEETEAEGSAGVYRRFRLEVEHSFKACRSVKDYAETLGYTRKGLYRAIMASAGLAPKQVIDERVSLEARRLLVHTSWPLKRIASELGFSEPTNFVKFFKRTCGQSPSAYRKDQLKG